MKSGNMYTVACTINNDSISEMKDICEKVITSLTLD